MNGFEAGWRRGFRRGALACAVVSAAVFLAGCFGTGGGDEPEEFQFLITPGTVWIMPGETATVDLTARRRIGEPLDRSAAFDVLAPETPADAPSQPADTDIRQLPAAGGATPLELATSATTEPGVYRISLRASLLGNFADQTRTLTLVVMPTAGGAPRGPVVQIAGGGLHSLARLADGSVWAWGRNDFGQLGDGTLIDRPAPVPVQGLPAAAVDIAAGDGHSLALLADGSVWGWGDRRQGQAGGPLGTIQPDALVRPSPVPVPTAGVDLGGAANVVAGGRHSIALLADGRLFSWGDNNRGQLGRPRGTDATFPDASGLAEEITHGLTITALAAGEEHSLLLDDGGLAFGWGSNVFDQLGLDRDFFPDTSQLSTPRLADLARGADRIGAGAAHTVFRRAGAVLAVGRNSSGQLGDGSTEDRRDPVNVALPAGVWEQLDGGFIHSLALRSTGEVWAWGGNIFGQVGEAGDPASDVDRRVPVRVTGLPSATEISAGGRHSLARTTGCGQVWGWGDDAVGQLGVGASAGFAERRPTPAPARGLADPAGTGCSVALALLTRGAGRIAASPGGIDAECASPCVAGVPRGTAVQLTATPATGASFTGWAGDCSGSTNPLSLAMAGDRVCIAEFTEAAAPAPVAPVAQFSFAPSDPQVGQNVSFDASASSDADGAIVAFDWDFDGDGTADASGVNVDRSFAAAGDIEVTLTVTDDDGLQDSATQTLSVADAPGGGGGTPNLVSLTVRFAGAGAAFGRVDIAPTGITLRADQTPFCVGNVCTVDELAGTVTLTPATEDPEVRTFFQNWQEGGCDRSSGQTCEIDLAGDTDITANFGRE